MKSQLTRWTGLLFLITFSFQGATCFFLPKPCTRENVIPGVRFVGGGYDMRFQEIERAYKMNATIYHFQEPFAEDVTDGSSSSDFPFTGIPSTITVSSNYGSRYYCIPPEQSTTKLSEYEIETQVFSNFTSVELQLAANVGVGFQTGMFANSTEESWLQSYRTAFSRNATYSTETHDSFRLYQLFLAPNARLSDEFIEAYTNSTQCLGDLTLDEYKIRVEMNTSVSLRCFLDFLETYGTHYVRSSIFGGEINYFFSVGELTAEDIYNFEFDTTELPPSFDDDDFRRHYKRFEQKQKRAAKRGLKSSPTRKPSPKKEYSKDKLRNMGTDSLRAMKEYISLAISPRQTIPDFDIPDIGNFREESRTSNFEVKGGTPQVKNALRAVYGVLSRVAGMDNQFSFNTFLFEEGGGEDIFVSWEKSLLDYPEPVQHTVRSISELLPKAIAPFAKEDADYMISQAAQIPEQPLPPFLTALSSTELRVAWIAPIDNAALIEDYSVFVTKGVYEGTGGVEHEIQLELIKLSRDPRQFEITIDNLSPYTTYSVQIAARNRVGLSRRSGINFGTTLADRPGPVTVANATYDPFTLIWVSPRDNGKPLLSCELEITGGIPIPHQTVPVIRFAPLQTYQVPNLCPNTDYTFHLTCENELGTSDISIPFNFTTVATIPFTPSAPMRVDTTQDTISLHLEIDSACPNLEDVNYTITYHAINPLDATVFSFTTNESEATIANLTQGTIYRFTTYATNSIGDSAVSEPSDISTEFGYPGELTLVGNASGYDWIWIEWEREEVLEGRDYDVYYNIDSGSNQAQELYVTSYNFTFDTAGTLYDLGVTIVNEEDDQKFNKTIFQLSTLPPDVPEQVDPLRLDYTETQFVLSWDPPFERGSPITHYIVRWEGEYETGERIVSNTSISLEAFQSTTGTTGIPPTSGSTTSGSTTGSNENITDTTDVTESTDVTDTTDATDTTDTTDSTDATDTTGTIGTTDTQTEARKRQETSTDSTDVTDSTGATDTTEITDTTDITGATDTTDVTDATNTNDTTGTTGTTGVFTTGTTGIPPTTGTTGVAELIPFFGSYVSFSVAAVNDVGVGNFSEEVNATIDNLIPVTTGVPTTGVPTTGVPTTGVLTTGVLTTGEMPTDSQTETDTSSEVTEETSTNSQTETGTSSEATGETAGATGTTEETPTDSQTETETPSESTEETGATETTEEMPTDSQSQTETSSEATGETEATTGTTP